jgi:hypothetical protein
MSVCLVPDLLTGNAYLKYIEISKVFWKLSAAARVTYREMWNEEGKNQDGLFRLKILRISIACFVGFTR